MEYCRKKINKITEYNFRIQNWINEIKGNTGTLKLSSRPHNFRPESTFISVLEDTSENLKYHLKQKNYRECELLIDWAKKTLYLIFVDSHRRSWFVLQTPGERLEGAQKLLEIINSFPGCLENKINSIGKKVKYAAYPVDWSDTYGNFNYPRILIEACSDFYDPEQISIVRWMLDTYMSDFKVDIDDYDINILDDKDLKKEYIEYFNPLEEACQREHYELIDLLLNKVYSDPNLKGKKFIFLVLKISTYNKIIEKLIKNFFKI